MKRRWSTNSEIERK